MEKMTLDLLKSAVAGHAAAFRCVTEYQPAGGPGDKIFPATYEGGNYAEEQRLLNGQLVNCVLIDSVQSQANRMELVLLEAVRAERIELPILEVRFDDEGLMKPITVTSLEAPHRIADAIFRDSMIEENGEKVMFRSSAKGKVLDSADARNATGLFGLCPTALVLGIWDSTGPRGGLGLKIQRAIVSEITGINAQAGKKTSSRIDPLQIGSDAGTLYVRAGKNNQSPHWTITEKESSSKPVKVGKKGRPSDVIHGNITPDVKDGGFTIEKAVQTTVISLAAIRRLQFPLADKAASIPAIDVIARTVLAALGLLGAVLAREEGADLRSRCQLFPTQEFVWEVLDQPGKAPKTYELDAETAISIFNQALEEAKLANLPWEGKVPMVPHPQLLELVRRSQENEARIGAEEA